MDVVIPAVHGGRDLDMCIQQVAESRGDLPARIIVATGDREYQPPPGIQDVEVLRVEGAHIFDLRAAGVAAATAPVVALTEDHCQVAPTWVPSILAAFEDPSTRFVKGQVANGAPCGLAAWANYYSNFAHYLADWPEGPVCPTGGTGASLAWRREAVPAPQDGRGLHVSFLPHLDHEEVRFSAGVQVTHWQRMRLIQVLAMQYHNGRTGAAFTREVQGLPRRSWGPRILWTLRANMGRLRTNFAIVRRHPHHRRRAWMALPAWFLIALAIAWGQWVGLARGAGASPHKIP